MNDVSDDVTADTSGLGGEDGPIDGRTARRQRNREAVIDALIALTAEGEVDPSVDAIADRAGVSYRSVYRYFADRSEMLDAAADRAMSWIRPMLAETVTPFDLSDPLDHRIDGLVDARSEVYAQIAEVARTALRRSHSEPRIAKEFIDARELMREQIAERFAPELDQFDERERELRITSIDHNLAFASLDYVVNERGHTREELERFLRGQIRLALQTPAADV
ncbi:MAG: TetR/AcrR family transcriptional regulator [Actinomycetota bacterium]